MIWVTSNVDGTEYKEPFSKGIMSRSLNVSYIGSKRAYEIASEIEDELIKNELFIISREELADIVLDHLISMDSKIAEKYKFSWVVHLVWVHLQWHLNWLID